MLFIIWNRAVVIVSSALTHFAFKVQTVALEWWNYVDDLDNPFFNYAFC